MLAGRCARLVPRLRSCSALALAASMPPLAALAAPPLHQQVRQMAQRVKGKGAVQKDGLLRKAAVTSASKADDEDLEVGKIVTTYGKHFEVELKSGRTYKVREPAPPARGHPLLPWTEDGCCPLGRPNPRRSSDTSASSCESATWCRHGLRLLTRPMLVYPTPPTESLLLVLSIADRIRPDPG